MNRGYGELIPGAKRKVFRGSYRLFNGKERSGSNESLVKVQPAEMLSYRY